MRLEDANMFLSSMGYKADAVSCNVCWIGSIHNTGYELYNAKYPDGTSIKIWVIKAIDSQITAVASEESIRDIEREVTYSYIEGAGPRP